MLVVLHAKVVDSWNSRTLVYFSTFTQSICGMIINPLGLETWNPLEWTSAARMIMNPWAQVEMIYVSMAFVASRVGSWNFQQATNTSSLSCNNADVIK